MRPSMRRLPKAAIAVLLLGCFTLSLLACSTPAPRPAPPVKNDLIVRFLDVGQGDAIFITLPGGSSMLVDAGTKAAGDGVVSTIEALGVKKIDYVVFTHPHEDHIGGAVAVLKAFDIGQIVMPRTSHTTQTYENLLDAIAAKALTVTEAKAGKVIIDGENLKTWLISPGKTFQELNDMSAVLALKYGDRTFIFEGDAGEEAEAAMTLSSSVQLPKADVLKVAHHGSASSSTKSFVEIVSPSIAVISVGAGNDYGHPTRDAIDRLVAIGAKVYRTDQHGTITVTTDGTTLDVKTASEPAAGDHRSTGTTP